MSEITKSRQRRYIANFFTHKVQELHYHLNGVVSACDKSLGLFKDGKSSDLSLNNAVVFGFSAFSNVVQTLKDATKVVTGNDFPWSKITSVRHGSFMKCSRNAITHDGNPIINSWVDGRFFIAADIFRLDNHDKVIEITVPQEDVRVICLQFSHDFGDLLYSEIKGSKNISELNGAVFDVDELEQAFSRSKVMPDFVKALYESNKAAIAASIQNAKYDPVAVALEQLKLLTEYCSALDKTV